MGAEVILMAGRGPHRVVDVVIECRSRSGARDVTVRDPVVRGAASWLLRAGELRTARVAEVLGMTGPGVAHAARGTEAELVAGVGSRADLVVSTIGTLARLAEAYETPSSHERLVAYGRETVPPLDASGRYDRSGCPPRPCHRYACRYHLRGDIDRCALDLAAEGPRTRVAIGEYLGISAEYVRQIEERGLAKLRRRNVELLKEMRR